MAAILYYIPDVMCRGQGQRSAPGVVACMCIGWPEAIGRNTSGAASDSLHRRAEVDPAHVPCNFG